MSNNDCAALCNRRACVTRWTYEQAVSLFMENTSLAEANIRTEVRRYITWPAQVWSRAMQIEYVLTELITSDSFEVFDSHAGHSAVVVMCLPAGQIQP